MKIRSHLLILVLTSVLPIVVFSAIMTLVFWREQRQAFEQRYLDRVRAMSIALDRELDGTIRSLQVLSESPHLKAGDLLSFYEQAQRTLSMQSAWTNIILIDAERARQIINLRRPYGAPLPEADKESLAAVLRAGQPFVPPLSKGPVSGEWATRIMVSGISDSGRRYVLAAVLKPESWLAFLQSYPTPPDATMTLLDQNGIVIARTLNPGRWIGQPASPALYAESRKSPEGAYINKGLEGQWFYTGHSRSKISGWTIATGVPKQGVEAALRESTIMMFAGATATAILAIMLAVVFGRRISQPVTRLARSAHALAGGEQVDEDEDTTVAEVAEVRKAFHESAQKLRAQESVLRETDRRKDEYLAMLGHELRNPLGVITSAVQLLRRKAPLNPELNELREIVEHQTEHMTRLMDDLLDVSRISRGQMHLNTELCDLTKIVRQTAEDYRATLESSGSQLIVNVPDASLWVSGDRTRLAQAVSNLIHNANKFSDPGAVVTVDLSENTAKTQAILVVRDTGIGMEPQVLAHLFEPFSQGFHGIERSRGGLGLGLALVKGLIDMQGGEVRANSEGPGRGAEITIQLPLQPPPATVTAAVPPAEKSSRTYRVLIIEDNGLAARTMKMFLSDQGHIVEFAHTGIDGIAVARRFRPEVVLCDIGLPECDGYTVARELRQETSLNGVYLIAVSGYGQESDKQRAWDAGFDAYLVKPINLTELETMLSDRSQGERKIINGDVSNVAS
jgi:signal transduction histidine kinase/ActR/RegA family two-component response regulator